MAEHHINQISYLSFFFCNISLFCLGATSISDGQLFFFFQSENPGRIPSCPRASQKAVFDGLPFKLSRLQRYVHFA